MAASVKIEGLKELRDRALKLEQRMRRKVFNAAARAGGKIVVAAAKAQVPVRTGSVRSSLVYRASSKPSLGLFGVKVTIKGGKKASARVAHRRKGKGGEYFPDAVERYYRFQELGTKHHPAKPFLRPALADKATEVFNVVKRELEAGLEREAKSL